MKAIDIKGKKYVTVNERLKAFRTAAEYAGYSLVTIAHELTNDVCVMEAQIKNKDGVLIANGFAREVRTQAGSMVNATSYVENCETSAWGRALANFGIGIDEQICSAQELLVALGMQQSKAADPTPEPQPKPSADAEPIQLDEREQEEFDAACAYMDAAETKDDLNGLWQRYKEARFAPMLKEHGYKVKKAKGWV